MPPKQDKTSSGKKIDNIYAHNKFVFYSCIETRIDLAHDATVGDRSRNLKFSTHHQDQSMKSSSNERDECIYIPL